VASAYGRVAPDDATGGAGRWAAWFANWSWPALFALAVFVLLLFPDGRLLPGRWRLAAWAGAAGTACLAAGSALAPGRLTDFPAVESPVGGDETLSSALVLAGAALTAAALAAGVAAVVIRYRRASETGRQQIKWLAVAAVVTAAGTSTGIVMAVAGADVVGYSLVLLSVLVVPVAMGVAILRYRLYDVDRVISRSLTYAVVTVTLAAAYTGLVLAGQALFSSFAGGGDLAIAGSTLVVAALFLPVRARVQRLVDRRFYRRRYDARLTLEAFGSRLRDEIDLGPLRDDLERVVHETMQPAHVSVWLRAQDSVTIP
jgi:hypothetical protein